jgi:hypothetical protein
VDKIMGSTTGGLKDANEKRLSMDEYMAFYK